MNISFKKDDHLYIFGIIAVVLSLAISLLSVAFDRVYSFSFSNFFAPVVIMILLLITKFSSFKDNKTRNVICLIILILAAFSFSISTHAVAGKGSTLSTYFVSEAATRFVYVSIIIGEVFFNVFMALWIVTYLIFILYKVERNDILNISKIGAVGAIIAGGFIDVIGIVSFFLPYSGTPTYYNIYIFSFIVSSIFQGIIFFKMINDTQYSPKENKEIADQAYDDRMNNNSSVNRDDYSSPSDSVSEAKKIEIIKKYKDLLDKGVITQEEFDNKKKEILK